MKIKRMLKLSMMFILIVFTNWRCIEPFDLPEINDSFESVLVIESIITNEFKQQKVKLTRSFEFGEANPDPEISAQVVVKDNQGNEFQFAENEPGIYLSNQAFTAVENTKYNLTITTNDGKNYISDEVELTQVTPIDTVLVERKINNQGQDGVAILVNSFDPTNNSFFYRYEYEETYKIVAPFWRAEDLITNSDNPNDCSVQVVPSGDDNEEICFGTNLSNNIVLANTSEISEDRITDLEVRFIDKNDFIIAERYSILVRQYIQSSDSYSYFETLQNLSASDNLFSQIQPGLLVGNVFSESDENEIVLGYFDVASIDEKRIFFNFEDFFPNEEPPSLASCETSAPPINDSGDCILANLVRDGLIEYVGENPELTASNPGPYVVMPRVCGDCTALGSNEVPSFWID